MIHRFIPVRYRESARKREEKRAMRYAAAMVRNVARESSLREFAAMIERAGWSQAPTFISHIYRTIRPILATQDNPARPKIAAANWLKYRQPRRPTWDMDAVLRKRGVLRRAPHRFLSLVVDADS